MSARGWIVAGLAAATAAAATTVAVRASRRREITGPRLPVRRQDGNGIRVAASRVADRAADLAGQAGEFVRIVSQESAVRQSELRRQLGLDE